MPVFVLSHNLQITSDDVPALSATQLAEALRQSSEHFDVVEVLQHAHWLVRLESMLSVQDMAKEVVRAWKNFREAEGPAIKHHLLALGGCKDSAGLPGSPLTSGSWGVDVVECFNPDEFLESINWNALKAGRPEDAVFEIKI